jgi:hypothetical protein
MFRRTDTTPTIAAQAPGNRLIAALGREEGAALIGAASRIELTSGDWAEVAMHAPMMWLPETAVLSFAQVLGGRPIECGMVGREGALGWEPVTGLSAARNPVGVVIGGTALAVPADTVAAMIDGHPRLAATLLRYRETLMAQLRLTVAVRQHCRPDARLARWLCMLHDRVEGDTLEVTHLRLAAFLNARRASVTDGLHMLEGERLIRCTRGKIHIRDRATLERRTDGGYGAPEETHRALIGPFGKSAEPKAG